MDIHINPAASTPYIKGHNIKAHCAFLSMGDVRKPCVIGAAGSVAHKCEGDNATPQGRFCLRRLWYRPDREAPPQSPLPIAALTPQSGWSDDPCDPHYNRLIDLPLFSSYSFSHEILWRNDHLYNLFFELGYNDDPIIKNAGSAIFLHLAPPHHQPTQGCIGVSRSLMAQIIARATTDTFIVIN